jgi:hypothetical protein
MPVFDSRVKIGADKDIRPYVVRGSFTLYFLIDEPENHRNFTGVSPELILECVMEWSGRIM